MVRTLDAMVLYTPIPCFDEWPDSPHNGSLHQNLVLTSSLIVRTPDAMVLYLEPCFDEWPDGPHTGCNGSLHLEPCFGEWPDGPHTRCNGSLHPKPCFDEWRDGPH